MKDYQGNIEELYKRLETNSLGLTEEEVKKRLNNNKFDFKQKSFNFIQLFNDYTTVVLFFIAIFSVFVSHIRKESLFISFILLIIVFLNIFLKLSKTKNNKPNKEKQVLVIRNQIKKLVPEKELVVGDIIELTEGETPFVDARIIEAFDLQVNEFMLTEESILKEKNNSLIQEEKTISEQNNMIFAGTKIVNGKTLCVVTKVGMDTELGNILKGVQEIKTKSTPLERKRNQVGKVITYIIVLSILIMLILGVFQKRNLFDVLVISLSLAIAAIPEGVNIIISLVLSKNINKIDKNILSINNIDAIETFGCIDTLIFDLNSFFEFGTDCYQKCLDLGISPIIMTADKNVNLNIGESVDGNEIEKMTDDELLNNILKYHLYININYKTKLRIIECYQTLGHIVGFIGNGYSNRLLLKKADLGIANDLSDKNISDCLLQKNDFSIINQAILKGRDISYKFQKMILYLLETSLIEVLLIMFSFFLDIELFTTTHILWLNIIVNSILAGLLCLDNFKLELNNNLLKNTYLNLSNVLKIIINSIIKSIIFVIIFFYYAKSTDILVASSLLFIMLIINSLIYSLSYNDMKYSTINNKILNNQILIIGVLGLIVIHGLLFTTRFSEFFIVTGIEIKSIGVILMICVFTFLIGEFVKPLYIKVFKN